MEIESQLGSAAQQIAACLLLRPDAPKEIAVCLSRRHQYGRASWLPATAAENAARDRETYQRSWANAKYAEITSIHPDGTKTVTIIGTPPRTGWRKAGLISIAVLALGVVSYFGWRVSKRKLAS